MRRLFALALAAGLAGCQGILGAGGAVTGFTVPPGCKGTADFSFPMPQGDLHISCDETGAVAAPAPVAAGPKALFARAAPVLPAAGAAITITRQSGGFP